MAWMKFCFITSTNSCLEERQGEMATSQLYIHAVYGVCVCSKELCWNGSNFACTLDVQAVSDYITRYTCCILLWYSTTPNKLHRKTLVTCTCSYSYMYIQKLKLRHIYMYTYMHCLQLHTHITVISIT